MVFYDWQTEDLESCEMSKYKERGQKGNNPSGLGIPGSPGRIRTCDTLINSQLRYHCATGELVGARSHKKVIYRIPQTMQGSISTFLRMTADEDSYLRII